ncbi:MAG: hypothetical protein EPO52_02570 [Herbiconiux sp.]|uniref:hypothetical protein n=1 Tax=Herbiconiux sp. TaxID=1871186 RepID=UPI001208173B|nr:hypothetical protein [Herbiconiux sp.]TAJ49842.1 MAG: hypothetical protein EPO52_02570 [Herbiconiux sp.]
MSTVDPVEARAQRERARIGSPGAVVGIVIGLVMIALGAALEVRALYGFAEFDALGDSDGPPLAVFGMIVGLPLMIIGFFVHTGATRRFTGTLLSAPGVGPLSILFVGFAGGAWWGASSVSTTGILWLIPIGVTALALLLLVIGISNRMRRRSRNGVLAHLATHGRIVAAEIVEIPEIDPSSGGLIGPITVTFHDADGTARWVTKTGQWKRRDLPKTGDAASVLFDPGAPDDTSRIWVAPVGSTSAADFSRWHS